MLSSALWLDDLSCREGAKSFPLPVSLKSLATFWSDFTQARGVYFIIEEFPSVQAFLELWAHLSGLRWTHSHWNLSWSHCPRECASNVCCVWVGLLGVESGSVLKRLRFDVIRIPPPNPHPARCTELLW